MLTATRSSQSCSGASAAGPIRIRPALFTTVSRRPNSATLRATAADTSSASVTSTGTTRAEPPADSISVFSSCSRSARRARRATTAPCAASAFAVAAPIPLLAPVTRAAVSASICVMSHLSWTPPGFPPPPMTNGRRPFVIGGGGNPGGVQDRWDMTQILADTAALVTGASSGIGAATAKALAAQGAVVALLARRADRLQELKTEIESAGGSALVVPVDVTDAEEVSAAVARSVAEFGRLDTVVNNAGLIRMG